MLEVRTELLVADPRRQSRQQCRGRKVRDGELTMTRRLRATVRAFAQRRLAAILFAGLALPWAPAFAAPARADHNRFHDPAARLQVVVNYVSIFDDGDWWGKGEFRLGLSVS